MRFDPKTSCDCGPLYNSQQINQLESIVRMCENTNMYKVMDSSCPPPGWEEFARQVKEKDR